MNAASAVPIQPRRAARRGSCLGRIEHLSPLPLPLRPTNTKTPVSSPSFDSAPKRPCRSTSPVPDRPASPVEIDKNDYGYGDDDPDKCDYGYGDMEPEKRNSPRSTRVVPSMELPNVLKEKSQRRGSALGRLQILPDDHTSELERFGIYEDKPDEDEDVRFTNKVVRIAPTDHRRARARRRGSALGRLQEDPAISTLSSNFRAELDKSVVYRYEDADANRRMTSTPSPKESKARRRGSALSNTSSSKSGNEEVDKAIYGYEYSGAKSAYGYEDSDTGSQEVDRADYGYGYDDDTGSQEVDYGYGYEDADSGSQDMIDKVDYGYGCEDADTNRNCTDTHSSREIKARRRGSALGRLQEDSTLSSAKMAIPDASPYRQPIQRRMSVGEINSKWTSPNMATPDAAPPRQPSRDRTSIGASDVPTGRPKDFAERYAEQNSMNQSSNAQAPIRRGSRRRSSVGASAASLDNLQEDTRRNSRTQVSINRFKNRRRMSVGATCLTATAIPVEPNVSAQSRQNESKERDHCDSIIRQRAAPGTSQRAPGRVNRRGSACARLQSGWDGETPDMAALDRILLAQGKMGLLNPSKAPLKSPKSVRRVNEYSIPW
jgi:hypothetical protein